MLSDLLPNALKVKSVKDLMFLLTVAGEISLFRFGLHRSLKTVNEKDLVIIRYSDWKKRLYPTTLEQIQITRDLYEIFDVENLILNFQASRQKTRQMQHDEEIVGMVLKKWTNTVVTKQSLSVSSSVVFTGIAVLAGDTVYIFYDQDWLRGLEITTPSQEEKPSLLRLVKEFLR